MLIGMRFARRGDLASGVAGFNREGSFSRNAMIVRLGAGCSEPDKMFARGHAACSGTGDNFRRPAAPCNDLPDNVGQPHVA